MPARVSSCFELEKSTKATQKSVHDSLRWLHTLELTDLSEAYVSQRLARETKILDQIKGSKVTVYCIQRKRNSFGSLCTRSTLCGHFLRSLLATTYVSRYFWWVHWWGGRITAWRFRFRFRRPLLLRTFHAQYLSEKAEMGEDELPHHKPTYSTITIRLWNTQFIVRRSKEINLPTTMKRRTITTASSTRRSVPKISNAPISAMLAQLPSRAKACEVLSGMVNIAPKDADTNRRNLLHSNPMNVLDLAWSIWSSFENGNQNKAKSQAQLICHVTHVIWHDTTNIWRQVHSEML